jgi:hypothetical protein
MQNDSPSTDRPLSKRERNRIAQRKYYAKNRALIIQKSQLYTKKNPEIQKASDRKMRWERNLKCTYGIVNADYLSMFESQGGCCAICLIHQSSFKRKLCVDHDHSTGKVRGLLCHSCNSALGLARDDVNILRAAISYLERSPE